MEFTINGQLLELQREQVEGAMREVDPETIRQHAVEIGGRLFPVKQVLSCATGLDRLDFTSAQHLKRLGFQLRRVAACPRQMRY